MRQSLDQAAAAGVKATLTSRPEAVAQQLLALPPEPAVVETGTQSNERVRAHG